MAETLSKAGKVITNDIDPKIEADHHMNAVQSEIYKMVGTDWIISNPPYSQALAIVQQSYEAAKVGCAFLLRLSFLEPTIARGHWLKDHPPSAMIVMPRISFTGDNKTDSVTVAWLIWDKSQVKNHPPFQFTLRSEMK